jgi:glycosyltransferase involved in cell wall biosynthesis
MKIAIFHNLPSGGAKRALYEYMRLLSSAGHKLDIFTLSTANNSFLPLSKFANHEFVFDYSFSGKSHLRILFLTQYICLIQRLMSLRRLDRVCYKIANKINEGGYDLAFIHHCKFTQAPYILKYIKIPKVYYCQEPLRKVYEPQIPRDYLKEIDFKQRLRQRWYAKIEPFYNSILKRIDFINTQFADLILANSYYSKESLYKTYDCLPKVNYLGIDTDKFRPLELKKENFILSVGALIPIKGHEFVIEALSKIASAIRPKLIIVGNEGLPVEEQYLEDYAKDKKVDLQILINIEDSALVNLYNRAMLTAYAAYLEPFGLVALESMACGTPVVGIREAGIRETVVDGVTGILTDRDTQAFAQAIFSLLYNEDLRLKMGMQAREYICKNWTWQKSLNNLLKNFELVLK